MIYLELWGIYEAPFFANARRAPGADAWSRFEKVICVERRGDLKDIWDSDYEGLLTFRQILAPILVEYIDNQCK
jgi:hypothetical protein